MWVDGMAVAGACVAGTTVGGTAVGASGVTAGAQAESNTHASINTETSNVRVFIFFLLVCI